MLSVLLMNPVSLKSGQDHSLYMKLAAVEVSSD